jgi:hypothetical protein
MPNEPKAPLGLVPRQPNMLQAIGRPVGNDGRGRLVLFWRTVVCVFTSAMCCVLNHHLTGAATEKLNCKDSTVWSTLFAYEFGYHPRRKDT